MPRTEIELVTARSLNIPTAAQDEANAGHLFRASGPIPLGWAFLRIGAMAFGGLGATLALLEHDFVKANGWPQSSDVAAAMAYTKPLPGSTVVQVVTFLGWRLGG